MTTVGGARQKKKNSPHSYGCGGVIDEWLTQMDKVEGDPPGAQIRQERSKCRMSASAEAFVPRHANQKTLVKEFQSPPPQQQQHVASWGQYMNRKPTSCQQLEYPQSYMSASPMLFCGDENWGRYFDQPFAGQLVTPTVFVMGSFPMEHPQPHVVESQSYLIASKAAHGPAGIVIQEGGRE